MWAAFRSDLKEFVTSVSEDTTSALSQIDARLQDSTNSDDDGDDNYDEAIIDTDDESSHNHENDDEESTTTTPMKKKTADNDAIMLSPGGGVVMADDGVGGGYEATGVIANASDEIARRRCDEETFTLELPDTVSELFCARCNFFLAWETIVCTLAKCLLEIFFQIHLENHFLPLFIVNISFLITCDNGVILPRQFHVAIICEG